VGCAAVTEGSIVVTRMCPSCGCFSLEEDYRDLSTTYICHECDQIWTHLGLEEAYKNMKNDNKKEITIKRNSLFPMPGYVQFGHRHLEKEKPKGVSDGTVERFIVPTDLLAIPLPKEVVDSIEMVELVYRKKVVG
jgi:hypothetical protein